MPKKEKAVPSKKDTIESIASLREENARLYQLLSTELLRRVDGYETETLIQRILSEYQGLESDFLDFNTFLTQIKQKEKSKQTDTIINQLVQQIDSIPKRQSKLLQELQQISEFTGSPSFETLNSEQISHSYDLINAIRYNHFAALELPWDPSHFTKHNIDSHLDEMRGWIREYLPYCVEKLDETFISELKQLHELIPKMQASLTQYEPESEDYENLLLMIEQCLEMRASTREVLAKIMRNLANVVRIDGVDAKPLQRQPDDLKRLFPDLFPSTPPNAAASSKRTKNSSKNESNPSKKIKVQAQEPSAKSAEATGQGSGSSARADEDSQNDEDSADDSEEELENEEAGTESRKDAATGNSVELQIPLLFNEIEKLSKKNVTQYSAATEEKLDEIYENFCKGLKTIKKSLKAIENMHVLIREEKFPELVEKISPFNRILIRTNPSEVELLEDLIGYYEETPDIKLGLENTTVSIGKKSPTQVEAIKVNLNDLNPMLLYIIIDDVSGDWNEQKKDFIQLWKTLNQKLLYYNARYLEGKQTVLENKMCILLSFFQSNKWHPPSLHKSCLDISVHELSLSLFPDTEETDKYVIPLRILTNTNDTTLDPTLGLHTDLQKVLSIQERNGLLRTLISQRRKTKSSNKTHILEQLRNDPTVEPLLRDLTYSTSKPKDPELQTSNHEADIAKIVALLKNHGSIVQSFDRYNDSTFDEVKPIFKPIPKSSTDTINNKLRTRLERSNELWDRMCTFNKYSIHHFREKFRKYASEITEDKESNFSETKKQYANNLLKKDTFAQLCVDKVERKVCLKILDRNQVFGQISMIRLVNGNPKIPDEWDQKVLYNSYDQENFLISSFDTFIGLVKRLQISNQDDKKTINNALFDCDYTSSDHNNLRLVIPLHESIGSSVLVIYFDAQNCILLPPSQNWIMTLNWCWKQEVIWKFCVALMKWGSNNDKKAGLHSNPSTNIMQQRAKQAGHAFRCLVQNLDLFSKNGTKSQHHYIYAFLLDIMLLPFQESAVSALPEPVESTMSTEAKWSTMACFLHK